MVGRARGDARGMRSSAKGKPGGLQEAIRGWRVVLIIIIIIMFEHMAPVGAQLTYVNTVLLTPTLPHHPPASPAPHVWSAPPAPAA
jgi:hypothetical protein